MASHTGEFWKILQIEQNTITFSVYCLRIFFRFPSLQLDTSPSVSRYGRTRTPNRNKIDHYIAAGTPKTTPSKSKAKNRPQEGSDSDDLSLEQHYSSNMGSAVASNDFAKDDVAGSVVFPFCTPKKSDGMKRKAENTPKSAATALSRMSLNSPKSPRMMTTAIAAALHPQNVGTPTGIRSQNKRALAKKAQQSQKESESSDDSDYDAEDSSDSLSDEDNDESDSSDDDDDEPRRVANSRNAVAKPKPVTLPIRSGTRGRPKKKPNAEDFIPDSDNYFLTAANKKVKQSARNADRLRVHWKLIV